MNNKITFMLLVVIGVYAIVKVYKSGGSFGGGTTGGHGTTRSW